MYYMFYIKTFFFSHQLFKPVFVILLFYTLLIYILYFITYIIFILYCIHFYLIIYIHF